MISTQTTATPKLFIGMDVHKKSWTVHFKTDLFDNKTITIPTDPAVLINYVEKHFDGHQITCCYEAGCCGYWIARSLLQHGWEVKVVNPADVPRNNKQDWQKTDKIDSRNLCKHLSDGNLKGIYIPGEQQEQLRSLFRRRIHLARQLRTIKNHIKSQLLYFGIKLPEEFDNPNWSRDMKTWIADVKWKFSSGAETIKSRLKQLEFMWYEELHISNELRAYCRKHYRKDYYLLKSVPGIGGITASAISSTPGRAPRPVECAMRPRPALAGRVSSRFPTQPRSSARESRARCTPPDGVCEPRSQMVCDRTWWSLEVLDALDARRA